MIEIVRILQTSAGSPSRWDGIDAGDRHYQFYFRYGGLRVWCAFDPDIGKLYDEVVFTWDSDNMLDSTMRYDELRERLDGVMILPETCSV